MSSGGSRRFRNILMAGLPGVGKSTFGKVYAQMSRTEFVELDKYVEKLAGKSVSEIFAQDGEAAFRALEAQCLERLLRRQRCTIALGGGTLSNPESLALARELGCIVLLTAPIPVVADRLWPSKNTRPLLSDCETKEQLADRLQKLLEERQASYSQADVVMETSFSSVDTLKIELSWLERNLLSEKSEGQDASSAQSDVSHLALRSIPLADSSYRSPREQKGSKEVNDRMERLLKAQRQKDRSERRERPDKKEKGKKHQPQPVRAGAPVEQTGPKPAAQGPVPQENTAPKPAAQGPVPRENSAPKPASQGPVPRENSAPKPASQGPVPRENSAPKPASQGPVPRENSAPKPAAQGPVPRENSRPRQASGGPVPVAKEKSATVAPAVQSDGQDPSAKDEF